MTCWASLLLFPVAPALGFALAAGYAPWLLPLLLLLYWGVLPPLLHGGWRRWAGRLPEPPRLPLEAYALLLPYLLYWGVAAKRGSSLGEARLAFLRGPGLGLPLAALLGLLLGVRLSPPLVSLGVLLLSLAFQRALRYRLGRRGGF